MEDLSSLVAFVLPYVPYLILIVLAIYFICGLHVVKQYDRLVVFRLGKFLRIAGPGVVWMEPFFNRVEDTWDLQDTTDVLNLANVATHNNVRVSLVITFTRAVVDPERLSLQVQNGWEAVESRAQAVVAEIIGNFVLDDVLQDRSKIGNAICAELNKRVSGWGVKVSATEISDIKIADPDIERALAMKARGEKEAEGELKRAELQKQIATELAAAAAEMTPDAWRLKGMEVLVELCRSANNNTILIPQEIGDILQTVRRQGA